MSSENPPAAKVQIEKPLLAFYCMSHNDPETSEVIFARSNVEARRRHTDNQGTDFNSAQITRKKAFDRYAPGPIPPKALMHDGWYFECHCCGRRLSYSDDDTWADDDAIAEMKEIAEHNAAIDAELAAFDAAEAAKPTPDEDENRPYRSYYDSPAHRRTFIESRKVDTLLDSNALRFVGNAVFCTIQCEQGHYAEVARINLLHAQAEKDAALRFPEGEEFKSGRYPWLEPSVEFQVPGLQYRVRWDPKTPKTVYVSNVDKPEWARIMARRKPDAEAA